MFEFLVDSISLEGLLLGRNGNRDIPVGTTFTTVRASRVHHSDGEFRTDDLGVIAEIALTLQEVHWYQRTVEVVPGGHTAGLRVTGHGLAMLANRLRELPPGNQLSLNAPANDDSARHARGDESR